MRRGRLPARPATLRFSSYTEGMTGTCTCTTEASRPGIRSSHSEPGSPALSSRTWPRGSGCCLPSETDLCVRRGRGLDTVPVTQWSSILLN